MEQRILDLTQRIQILLADKSKRSAIDIDLMLDYTRVLYADLLEMKKNTPVSFATTQLTSTIEKQEVVSVIEKAQPTIVANSEISTIDNTNATNEKINTQETAQNDDAVLELQTATTPIPMVEKVLDQHADNTHQVIAEIENDPSSAIAFEPPSPPTKIEEIIDDTLSESTAEPPAKEPFVMHTFTKSTTVQHDVRNAIGINDKYQFLNELFNNHKSEYENALDEINKLNSLEDGIAWVKSKASMSSIWDEESLVVQSFLVVLKKHFLASK